MIEKEQGPTPEETDINTPEQIIDDQESTKDVGQEGEPTQMTLVYDQDNWQTKKVSSVEVEFDGNDTSDLYQKALNHLIGLEMSAQPVVAKNTKVKIGGQEMSWEEFEGQATKVQG